MKRNMHLIRSVPFLLTLFVVFCLGVSFANASDGTGTATVSKSPSTTLVNSTGNTLTFTYTAAESMNSGGITLTVPAGWSAPQGVSGTAGYTTVSTTGVVGSVFNEADSLTGWVHNTTNPTACSGGFSIDTVTKHSGTGSLKCVNSSDSNNGLWYYSTTTAMDWSSYQTIGFWINTSAPINNGDLKFDYSVNTDLSSPLESLSLGTSIPANTWTYVSFNFGATTRSAIKSYGMHIANLSAMRNATVNIDSFSIGASTSIVPTFSGNDIIVSAISLTTPQTITITYGANGGTSGAVAPSSPQTSTFTVKSKIVDSGTLTSIATSPTVSVIDTTVPTSWLTVPASSATIHGSSVTLTATSSDNVAVAGVTFYYDSTHRIGSEITATTSPNTYTSTLNSTGLSDGTHTLIAVARDTSNNYATSTAVSVTVDNTGPTFDTIASSTAATTATVSWHTSESSDSKVSYGTSSGTYTVATSSPTLTSTHSLGLTGLTSSTLYYYVVVSADAYGNISTSSEQTLRTLDVTAPSVSLTAPTDGATILGSSVSLAATATDNIAVAGVKFYVDGSLIGTEDTTASYTGTLNSTTLTNGSHSIVAVARDTSNNYATSTPAVVTVNNPSPNLTSVGIVSNNVGSTTLAKVGDVVTISFTSDQVLRAAIVSIAGHTVSVATTTSTSFTATYTMTSGDSEGAVSFSIAPTNTASLSGYTTSTTTNSSLVRFDKTAPTNEDTVFAASTSKQGGATVTITPSSDSTDTIWFAPAGTTTFAAGSTMTSAAGSATSIAAPSAAGTYVLYVIDAAGNISVASLATLTVDNNPPGVSSVSISSSNGTHTLAKPGDIITLSFTATKEIDTPTVSFSSGGAPVAGDVTVQHVTGNNWTATYTADPTDTSGSVTFSIDGLQDVLGNMASAVTVTTDSSGVTFDGAAPTFSSVTLASSNASTTLVKSGDTITLSFTSSETISTPTVTFSSGGSPVTNSVNVTHSGNAWSATYTTSSSDSEGNITFSISSYHDNAGNNGSTVTSGSGTVALDHTAPTVALSSGTSATTGESPIPVTATFSESVTGFTSASIVVANGSVSNLSGSGAVYTFDVTPSTNGAVTVDINAGAAHDASGNDSAAPTQFTRTFNSTRPTVSLHTSAGSKTNRPSISITVNFSASVTSFLARDLAPGLSNASVTDVTGSGSTYTITVVPEEEGTVSIQFPADVVVDTDTNTNQNFASSPLSLVYDATPPSVAEAAAIPSVSHNRSPHYTFSSNEGGTYHYSGGCGTGSGSAAPGNNTLSFSSLTDGTYSNCTVVVTDDAGNVSSTLDVSPFVVDTVPPVLSSVRATPAPSSSAIGWVTNKGASTQVLYGLTSAYGSSTPESDVVTRGTSHTAAVSGLVSCATYHYTASSTDEAGNSGVGSDDTFTTHGCAGEASVLAQNASTITRADGGTVSLISDGTGVSLSVPAEFADVDAQFQLKKLDKTASLGELGVPDTFQTIGDYVYDLHSLASVETAITTFVHPVAVTLNYTADDIRGMDESSLQIFRNDDHTWTPLDSCSVNTSAKSITCYTNNFSTFSVFGKTATIPPVTTEATVSAHGVSHVSGGSVQGQVKNLITMGNQKAASSLMSQWPTLFPQTASSNSTSNLSVRDLSLGMKGADVASLQQFLITQNVGAAARTLAQKGVSGYFGTITRAALIEYQKISGILPATGRFGPRTRSYLKAHITSGLWW